MSIDWPVNAKNRDTNCQQFWHARLAGRLESAGRLSAILTSYIVVVLSFVASSSVVVVVLLLLLLLLFVVCCCLWVDRITEKITVSEKILRGP
jgi:hypothetical protein